MPTEAPLPLHEPFVSTEQECEAATFGMWIFLATEVLFFGGLLMIYAAYRIWYPHDFAVGSRHLNIALGTINTAVLILSSFFMAGAVTAARARDHRPAILLLLATAALGVLFLGIKAYEWHDAARSGFWPGTHWFAAGDPPHGVRLFFSLYYVLTGLHGVHLIVGIVIVGGTALRWMRQKVFLPNQNQTKLIGLYWHFIDIVWIFLYPLLYLMGRSG